MHLVEPTQLKPLLVLALSQSFAHYLKEEASPGVGGGRLGLMQHGVVSSRVQTRPSSFVAFSLLFGFLAFAEFGFIVQPPSSD